MIPITIRLEGPADVVAIRHLTDLAFKAKESTSSYESRVVDGLRSAGALTLSLVAVTHSDHIDPTLREQGESDKGRSTLLGHIAFSPMSIIGQTGQYYGLGPISVHPSAQKQGIGSALVREGLDRIRALGPNGVVLLGDPSFYGRLGFHQSDRLWYAGAPKENFMVFQMDQTGKSSGEVRYHDAFTTAVECQSTSP